MNQAFPTRLQIVNAEPDAEFTRSRWAMVEWLRDSVVTDVAALVRLAYGGTVPDFEESFITHAQELDPTFRADSRLEILVLCSCALDEQMSGTGAEATAPALAITTTDLVGCRPTPECGWLIERARSRCGELSDERYTAVTDVVDFAVIDAQRWSEIADLSKENNHPAAFEKLATLTASIAAAVGPLSRASKEMLHNQGLYQEELDLLWWLTSRSKEPIANRSEPRGPSVVEVARQCAEFINHAPGPRSLGEIIRRALASQGETVERKRTLSAMLGDGSRDELVLLSQEYAPHEHEEITPVLCAVTEAAKSTKWKEAFETRSGLSLGDCRLRPSALASQLVREILLLDLLSVSEQES